MSDHTWALEQLASYVAGGLEPDERERFEQHLAACPACAEALAEARALDQTVQSLFTTARPAPDLEDRMIRALRQRPRRHWPRLALFAAVPVSAAAVVMLGVVGTFISHLITERKLTLPGAPAASPAVAANYLHYAEMGGIDSRLAAQPSALQPESLSHEPVPGQVTHFNAWAEQPPDATALAKSLQVQLQDQVQAPLNQTYKVTDSSKENSAKLSQHAGAVAAVDAEDKSRQQNHWFGFQPNVPSTTYAAPVNQPSQTHKFYLYTDTYSRSGTVATTPPPAVPAPAATPTTAGAGTPATGTGLNTTKELGDALHFMPNVLMATTEAGKNKAGGAVSRGYAVDGKPADTQLAQQLGKGESKGLGAEQGKSSPAKVPEGEPAPAAASGRKIIRSGEVEYEVESFDAAVATITRLVTNARGGFIATINSDKLANGKVRGSVVVRVPPERLDGLLLELRKELTKAGDLKGQRIGSQDITKQYTDLESRLKAARAMEERLLQIIKTGKGEIKDLLLAEKELGVWRTKIEEFEGELRYYANQVALSTLTIQLTEKEIRAPSEVTISERVQMGVETEDVDKAQREALKAVADAKGRVSKAELKQHAAGQYSAVLNFEVSPEAAGPLRDRLKQLGTVARFDVERVQQADDGSGKPADGKVRRRDVQFFVSFYNLANVAPRETVQINLATPDAEGTYRSILARVQKAVGRVVTSNLSRQRNEQTKGTIHFEVKTTEAEAVLAMLKEAGEVMLLQVTENPDTQNVTLAKRGFQVQVWSLAAVAPRETTVMTVATRDVPAAYRALQAAVARAKGRVLNAQLTEQDRQNITGQLDFDVQRSEEASVETALAAAGDVVARTVTRAQDTDTTVESKVRLQVKLLNVAALPPRETVALAVEVRDVDQSAVALTAYATEAGGRVVQSQVARTPDGRVIAKLVFDVPLAASGGLVEKFKAAGIVRKQQTDRNAQVPDGKLAVARLDVTLSNADLIVPSDDGWWPQIRLGLQMSFTAIAWSLTVVIIGLCFVLPWALVLYGVYALVTRLRRRAASSTP